MLGDAWKRLGTKRLTGFLRDYGRLLYGFLRILQLESSEWNRDELCRVLNPVDRGRFSRINQKGFRSTPNLVLKWTDEGLNGISETRTLLKTLKVNHFERLSFSCSEKSTLMQAERGVRLN